MDIEGCQNIYFVDLIIAEIAVSEMPKFLFKMTLFTFFQLGKIFSKFKLAKNILKL